MGLTELLQELFDADSASDEEVSEYVHLLWATRKSHTGNEFSRCGFWLLGEYPFGLLNCCRVELGSAPL